MMNRLAAAAFGAAVLLLTILPGTAAAVTTAPASVLAPARVFTAALTGGAEVPPVTTSATGAAQVVISADGLSINYQVTFSGLSGALVAAHINTGAAGTTGGAIFPLAGTTSPLVGNLTTSDFTASGAITTYAQAVAAIQAGTTYVSLDTVANSGGEIRGQLGVRSLAIVVTASLTGGAEVPPVVTGATGSALVVIYHSGTINYQVTYSGLSGPVTLADISVGAPGTNGGVVFPLVVGNPVLGTSSAANFTATGSITTYGLAITEMVAGNTYVNLHTATNLGGEIRGQLAQATTSGGATYNSVTPARILDTRFAIGLSNRFVSTTPREFVVAGQGGVGLTAIAVTGNLTVTGQTQAGYVSLTLTSQSHPATSTLNFPLGDSRANGVTVPITPGGHLWATYVAASTLATTNLIFDVTGYFTPDTSGATYHSVTPARILDTRTATGLTGKFVSTTPRDLTVRGVGGVPSSATAVTGNLTVTGQTGAGFVALTLTSQSNPTTSTLNFPLGDSRANGVTVPLTAGGHLWATYVAASSLATTNLIFDVTGYFTPDLTGATYHNLTPARILDTRTGTGLTGKFVSTTARSLTVAGAGSVPAGAIAVTGNLTVTGQTGAGFVALTLISQSHPTTSTLNFPLGDSRANGVTVPLSAGADLWSTYVAASSSATTNLLFDVTGYFTP